MQSMHSNAGQGQQHTASAIVTNLSL